MTSLEFGQLHVFEVAIHAKPENFRNISSVQTAECHVVHAHTVHTLPYDIMVSLYA